MALRKSTFPPFVLLVFLLPAACEKQSAAPEPPVVRKVELQVRSSTWRKEPPLDIAAEITRKLRAEGIQVVPTNTAGRDGLVAISYEESEGQSYAAVFGGAPGGKGTNIAFEMTVLDGSAKTLCALSAICTTPREVSSGDLYQGAIDELRACTVYVHAGPFAGAALGVATSMPRLLPATLLRNTRQEALKVLKASGFVPSGPSQEATWAAAQEDFKKCAALGAPAVDPLLTLFKEAFDRPQMSAIARTLGEIGDARAEQTLMEPLWHYSSDFEKPGDAEYYIGLLEAIGQMGDALALKDLETFSTYKNPEIVRAAQAAAEKIRTRVAGRAPKPVAATGQQALEKFAAFDDAGALALIGENPDQPLALALRGALTAAEAYYGAGNPAKQESVTRCRREWTPLWGEDLGFEALSAEAKARCRSALKASLADVERAAERDRVDERISVCRGLVYLWRIDTDGVENADQAIADFTHAIQLNADSPDPYYYRAWARFKQTPQGAFIRIDEWSRSARSQPGTAPPPPALDPEIEKALALYDLWLADFIKWGEVKEKNPGAFRLNRPGYEWATLGTWSLFLGQVKQALAQVAREMDDKSLFESAREAIVQIRWENGEMACLGTGFGIEEITGMILTNKHVVKDAPGGRVTVVTYGGKELEGRVAAMDPKRDLAIVGVRSLSVPSLRVMPPGRNEMVNSRARFGTKVTVGERVVVIGHPEGMEWSIARGIVSAERVVNGVGHLQTDAAVNHGNSGGPILNSMGEIVGVATWGVPESEGLNFGILSEEVLDFVNKHR